jgi:translation initiation factor 6 (eIF-6)
LDITKDIVGWLIAVGGISILSMIGTAFAIIKSGIMLPKEVECADLKNKETEISIVSRMEESLSKAIDRTAEWQIKFDKLDAESRQTKAELDAVRETAEVQGERIKIQDERILVLESLSETQKCEIDTLTKEVSNYSLWTNALVAQLERVNLKPVRMEEVEGVDTSAIRKNGGKKTKV